MRVLPAPALYKVPEPQPPPSCIPNPNKKDPTITETPTGPKAPTIVEPKKLSFPIKGIINNIANPIANN